MTQSAYELLGPLARGGYSNVWLARMRGEGGELVAIKRLRRCPKKAHLNPKKKHRLREQGRMEFELHRRLVHPNIVRMKEYRPLGGSDMLIMEYVNGLALDEWLELLRRSNACLPLELALETTIQAGRGLDHAHRVLGEDGKPLSIIHRDVKPSNIMIGRDGRVRVMDFGVARWALAAGSTTTGTIKGTLRYLSPEQAQGERGLTSATDQYSLALVLAEMVIGRPVYDARRDHEILLMAMRADVEPAIDVCERVSPGLGSVLERALQRDPLERYPDIHAMLEALTALSFYRESRIDMAAAVHQALELRARLALEEPGMIEHCDEIDFWNTTTHKGFGAKSALALHAEKEDVAVDASPGIPVRDVSRASPGRECPNLLSVRAFSPEHGFSADDALDWDLLRANPESEEITTEMVAEIWSCVSRESVNEGNDSQGACAASKCLPPPHIRVPGSISPVQDVLSPSSTTYSIQHAGRDIFVGPQRQETDLPFVRDDEPSLPLQAVSLWASDSQSWPADTASKRFGEAYSNARDCSKDPERRRERERKV